MVSTVTENLGAVVARVMSGSFMTSLEMAGMSLTVMQANEEILRLFGECTSLFIYACEDPLFYSIYSIPYSKPLP